MGLRQKQFYHHKNIFFITTTCHNWLHLLTVGNSMDILSDNLNFYSNKYNAAILGYVLMPNHIHLIIHFVMGNERIDFMRDFKKYTSTKIRQEVKQYQPAQLENLLYQLGDQKYKVWQDRFDELYLDSKTLLEVKLDYIHDNPLQSHWNLVKQPSDYSYSSAMFYEKGIQNRVMVHHYMDFV
jgi:putative transposase